MEKLYNQIKKYIPYNAKEASDKEAMLFFMERNPDCLLRTNLCGHFAATAWVVNRQRTKVLMIYHNIYNSWSWAGGHADGRVRSGRKGVRRLFRRRVLQNTAQPRIVRDDLDPGR